ncbi:uncharacterized protein PHACADRAFT_144832 [Phanerochaete carnosa HHB-10118-sp]|uniref:DUF6593 domain-containing protein n=1 Tax=Phanerochaete carnosa (strain HHB-10118-sp) TaxID=650164 RepID=K5VWJ0_PHACS|nr:uncharacterized protein PHACADRAFT_144832 [Phanerochaete carnosa HHB-10118-sp]EKM55913.1 hypothetical protein PHACADRAFT_144832 [Phanerochaete carnosa HHB-10118-sp]
MPPAAEDPSDIFFTGATNPRHGSVMIGWVGQKPVYFEFETPVIATSETLTTIYRNGRQPAASFEWTMGTHMGMATVGGRKVSMLSLVAPGTDSSARVFRTTDGRMFEWRKVPGMPGAYDLNPGPGAPPIARFSRFSQPQDTPVGPSHALLQCRFDDDNLLLWAALALCLNRWVDLHGY